MLFITIFENRPIKIKAIIETDRAAYLIFLTHCLAILAVNTAMELLGIKSISLSYVIRIITVYPVTIIGCVLYHRAKSCALLRLTQKSQDLT